MFSLNRTASLLVLFVSATVFSAHAQSSSSQPEQPAEAKPAQTSGATSVQARIRARREQRRAAAINDVYSHRYEAYVGAGYLRFEPGATLQRATEYSWDVGVTRYFSQKLGLTGDARGIYGTAYLEPSQDFGTNVSHPRVSEYTWMAGPTYRFLLHPKYSVSGRVMAGGALGNFSSDTNGYGAKYFNLWPDGMGLAASAGVPVEYNFSPKIGLRLTPEYLLTSFGSTTQNSFGFTAGVVVRWGKQ
jgi:hypothetical protein